MKRRTTKAVATLSAAAALMLGLSACESSDEERRVAIDELQKRGFQDVKFLDDNSANDEMQFTAKLDECRLDIGKSVDEKFTFRSIKLSDEQSKALRAKVGGLAGDEVNASFVRKYATELGLQHCMKVTPTS